MRNNNIRCRYFNVGKYPGLLQRAIRHKIQYLHNRTVTGVGNGSYQLPGEWLYGR